MSGRQKGKGGTLKGSGGGAALLSAGGFTHSAEQWD
jgi:hypothetical protein